MAQQGRMEKELDEDGVEEIEIRGRAIPDQVRRPVRRDLSPSAMSQSSAVLEWDPSADVGAMGNTASSSIMHVQGSSNNNTNEFRGLQEIPSCKILFGPTFDASGRKTTNRPNSRSSQSNPVYAYSTPSASPVPLPSLDYSPVAPEGASVAERAKSRENLNVIHGTQKQDRPPRASNVEDSSESNNNDELTEDRRTPGRVVSEASTDWEYDNEKKSSSKYVSDWQTNGITRSEIEYRNRKKSGSSTSAASSIFLLQVQGNMKNQCKGSPDDNLQNSDKSKEGNSVSKSDESSEMERKMYNIIKRQPGSLKHRQQIGSSSESDPSSMCLVVNKFIKVLEDNAAKDGIKYDVLKNHRDYHMTKVWKQISKLEKLNQALLAYKRRPKERNEKIEATHASQGTSLIDLRSLQAALISAAASHGLQDDPPPAKNKSNEYVQVTKSSSSADRRADPNYAALSELIAQLVAPGDVVKQREVCAGGINLQEGPTLRSFPNVKRTQRETVERGYSSDPSTYAREKSDKGNMKQVMSDCYRQRKKELREASIQVTDVKRGRKSPLGFFIPLFCEGEEFVEDKPPESSVFNVRGAKTIQECLKEHNPQCYQSIKERDDFLITIKRERQVHNETLLREALESNMAAEEIDDFLKWNYRHVDADEKRRLKVFWKMYIDSQKLKENKENVETLKKPHVISSKEMKERTQRLRMNDPAILAKQRKEADERRKKASRTLQKNFSTNLRQFQKLGSVNIPDRMKVGPRPR